MSMISGLIDRLRRAAQTYRELGKHEAEQMLLDAADTIWQLRDDLQRANAAVQDAEHDESMAWDRVRKAEAENAKLRERIHELEMEGSDHFYRTAYAEDANRTLEAENAKLRTFLGGGSIVTDYWKDEDGTMHVLTTDGEHTYEYMRGGLADENAKLRTLCADMNKAAHMLCEAWEGSCSKEAEGMSLHAVCPISDTSELCVFGKLYDRMRELGIEVDA